MQFSNYFPASYQQPLSQQQVQPNSTSIVWVQGEAGAKAYPVAPNTSVLLMDSESETFYIKTTDISGMPQPLRIFTYTEKVQNVQPSQNIELDSFVTRDEFEKRLSEIANYRQKKEKKDESSI